MSATIELGGIDEINRKLAGLPEKVQKKIFRSALSAGLTIEVKAMRRLAPVGPTGLLRSSIGKRIKFHRDGSVTAKAGINVGSRAKVSRELKAAGFSVKNLGRGNYMRLHNQVAIASGLLSPHAHLVGLGTHARTTKSGANRGVMPANHFIRQAAASVAGAVFAKIESIVRTKLEAEVAK